MKRITIVVAGLLSVLLIACGGGSDPESSDTLTRAELVKKGDAVCQKANDDLTPLAAKYSAALKKRDYEEAGNVVDQIALVAGKRTEGLESLDAPEEDADAVDQYADYSQQTEELMQAMADSLREKDSNAIAEATEGINAIAIKAQKTAREIGFEKCGAGTPAT